MELKETISVELIYIEPDSQNSITLDLDKGANIAQAIQKSGFLQRFPKIDLTVNKVGIFSKIQSLNTELQAGDRIEIYRALLADPKEARRQRAKKK